MNNLRLPTSPYAPIENKLPQNAEDLPNFMRKMKLDPDNLFLMTIDEYKKGYTQLCYDKLPLVTNGTGRKDLVIDIRNIVMTIILYDYRDPTKGFYISLDHVRKKLLKFGITYNRKKFRDVQLSLSEPFNLSIFIFERGQLDFKGGSSLIRVYLTAEFILSKFRKLFGDKSFGIMSKSIKNIVSTAQFDFCPSTDELSRAYPGELSKVEGDRFPGAHFTVSDPVKSTNIVFLIFDNPKVICVGANDFEHMRAEFENFYEKARALPHFDPEKKAVPATKKRKRQSAKNQQNQQSNENIATDTEAVLKRTYKRRKISNDDESELAIQSTDSNISVDDNNSNTQ